MSAGVSSLIVPVLPTAAEWLSEVMTGSAARAVAVLAVAALGLLMLAGRVPTRRGGAVIIGCFVLFAAQGIASAVIAQAARDLAVAAESSQPPPAYRPAEPAPVPYDPYAGASVPQQAAPQQSLR